MIFLFLAILSTPLASDRTLDQAVAERNTAGVITRIQQLSEDRGVKALADIATAIGQVEAVPETKWHAINRHRIFVSAIGSVSKLPGNSLYPELKKLLKKLKEWPSRVFLLEASLQADGIDSVQLALSALDDRAPQVAAVAARILGHSKDVLALEPLISAMTRWEEPKTREKASRGGREQLSLRARDRAWLSCRDALHRLTGISLHGAKQYKNWISAHRDEIDPSQVDLTRTVEQVTGTGLFGLDITGKNIAFILDVSGSMLATDPPSEEQIEKARRGTGVDESLEEKLQELMENRRRILRARSQLSRAIEGLGDDKRFTVISYSSEIKAWSDVLVEATRKNRLSASAFVKSLKAQGVTVTDDALHLAFSDPTIDTIYLITDGAPTHIGSQGDRLPLDARQLMQQILLETKARNHLRGVRIFTLGFVDAEEDFLKQLSGENSGKYVRIR